MFRFGMFVLMFHATLSSAAASGQVAFHEDPFGAGFAGDAIYFVSRTRAGEEMTVLVADTPDLCEAIKSRHGDADIRLWMAEVTERAGDLLQINSGAHVILTDDDLYDDSFEHRGGVAMLAYIHKRTAPSQAPAFVGMAARGHLDITSFDRAGGSVAGNYNATFQLGYNKGAGGYLQAASTGRFVATHCPEGPMWHQALLGASDF